MQEMQTYTKTNLNKFKQNYSLRVAFIFGMDYNYYI